jgi:hypothetical protein
MAGGKICYISAVSVMALGTVMWPKVNIYEILFYLMILLLKLLFDLIMM